MLVLHSENDLRCNIEQGEHLFTMLRLLGKEVEMVRFPAESHELSRAGSPIHRVQRFEAILSWFDKYLVESAAHFQPVEVPLRGALAGEARELL